MNRLHDVVCEGSVVFCFSVNLICTGVDYPAVLSVTFEHSKRAEFEGDGYEMATVSVKSGLELEF